MKTNQTERAPIKDVILDSATGEAAIKWWDQYVRNNPGLIVGCSLLEAFSAGFKAGKDHAVSELFKQTAEPNPQIHQEH